MVVDIGWSLEEVINRGDQEGNMFHGYMVHGLTDEGALEGIPFCVKKIAEFGV